MDSFKVLLVSNASVKRFPNNTLITLTIFLAEKLNLEGQWEVAISEKSYPSIYQFVREDKVVLFDTKLSNSSEFYSMEPGLYH